MDESLDKKKKEFEFFDQKFLNVEDIPQQANGSDCGVFLCVFAEYFSAAKEFNFYTDNMTYFRNKIFFEILLGQLS